MSESLLVAFGAAEPVVRHVRAKIMRGQMRPDDWIDALIELDAILDIAALTVYERFIVREAMVSLINQERALLNSRRQSSTRPAS